MRGCAQLPSSAPGMFLGSRPSVAGTLRLSANDAPEYQRPTLLREFFERLGVRYDIEPAGGDPIEIDLTLQGLPGLQLLSGRMQGARFRRTRESSDPTDDVCLMVNPGGPHLISQRGREIVLEDGEATLLSLNERLDSTHRSPGDFLVLLFPGPSSLRAWPVGRTGSCAEYRATPTLCAC